MPPVTLFDTHCHLDVSAFDEDREAVWARAQSAGVSKLLNPAYDMESSRRALALAQTDSAFVCAVGIHPNSIGELTQECLYELEQLARGGSKVVAVGEIGLDYHWDTHPRPLQHAGFVQQIHLAQTLNLPIIIHCRDAYDDCMEILLDEVKGDKAVPVLLHSFAGSPAHARVAVERGWFLGIGGPITYKKSHELRDIVKRTPLEQLVIETDAPYLPPEPYRGKRNEPAHVRVVAEHIAGLRGTSLEQIANITLTNAQRLFNLA